MEILLSGREAGPGMGSEVAAMGRRPVPLLVLAVLALAHLVAGVTQAAALDVGDAAAQSLLGDLVAQELAVDAPTIAGSPASVAGDAGGEDLVSDATVQAFATANAQLWADLAAEAQRAQANDVAVVAALRAAGLSLESSLAGMGTSLAETLARAVELVAKTGDSRDHDAQDEGLSCAGLSRDAAALAGPASQAGLREGIALALAELDDAGQESVAAGRQRRERILVKGSAMQAESGFSADWLLPAGGLVADGDEVRQLLFIDVLSNPSPSAGVPEAIAGTAAGKAAAMLLLEKSALVALARGALGFVAGESAPLPVYREAGQALYEDLGDDGSLAPDAGTGAAGTEEGYSHLQFVRALDRHFLGATAWQRQEAAGAGELWRRMADIERHAHDLAVHGQRAGLWKTALLAALVGGEGARRGQEVERLME